MLVWAHLVHTSEEDNMAGNILAGILPQRSFGGDIGQALGTGLGSGLQNLANMKLQEMQQRKISGQTEQALSALGFSPEESAQLAPLAFTAPQAFQQVVKQREQQRGLDQLFGGGFGQQQLGDAQIPQEGVPLQPQQQALSQYSPEEITRLKLASTDSPGALAKTLGEIRQERERREERGEKKELEQIKFSKDDLKDLRKKTRTAKEDLKSLDRLEEIDKKGELDSASWDTFLKNSGMDIAALRSPGTQEYNKIVNNFVRNIKDIFGARISNQEMEQFMKTLPNLSQSPEGRKRVVANLKRQSRIQQEYGKVAREIIKDNGGVPPLDIMDQVEERMDKRLDKFAEQFKKDIARPVPKGDSSWGVAGAALAGKAVPVAAGAGLGALAGSVVPGIGTAIGAGIGAGASLGKNYLSTLFSS